jgi:hypothetical protein
MNPETRATVDRVDGLDPAHEVRLRGYVLQNRRCHGDGRWRGLRDHHKGRPHDQHADQRAYGERM